LTLLCEDAKKFMCTQNRTGVNDILCGQIGEKIEVERVLNIILCQCVYLRDGQTKWYSHHTTLDFP